MFGSAERGPPTFPRGIFDRIRELLKDIEKKVIASVSAPVDRSYFCPCLAFCGITNEATSVERTEATTRTNRIAFMKTGRCGYFT
jgi:hypothetical protein